jgi:hypothetical protein
MFIGAPNDQSVPVNGTATRCDPAASSPAALFAGEVLIAAAWSYGVQQV